MRYAILASALALSAFSSGSAEAASFVSGPGSVSLDRTDAFSWTTTLSATAGSGIVGTTGSIIFNFLSANAAGTVWNFSYSVDNTSTAPSASSELSSFGFNTSPNPTSATAGSGIYAATVNAGNFNGLGVRDVCLYAGSNCNGGSSNGVGANDAPAAGTFSLNFGTATQNLVLNDFAARWQSTGANGQGSASGPGMVTSAVPEPATWGMMILGFGAIGLSLRTRKKAAPRQIA